MTKIYVGIDIAKYTHYATIIDSNGEVLAKPFPFDNTKQGFNLLLSKLNHLSKKSIVFGMESTAHYANNLSNFLLSKNFDVVILNPLQTFALRKTNMRDAKNDKIDSMIICRALMMNLGVHVSLNDTVTELYDLCKSYQEVTKSCSRIKTQLKTFLDILFPEYAKEMGKSVFGKASFELLKQYSTPSQIIKVRIDRLTNVLRIHSHGKFGVDKARRIKELASNSVGIQRESTAVKMRLAISQIELYESQKIELKAQIKAIVESLDSPIMTIPGMGYVEAAMILSSIKDIKAFSSPSKVLAYAGLDPRVRQSGTFRASTTRMSKRGNSMLRYALIWACQNVHKHDSTFNQYYQKKRAEGKTHYCALGHTANKLTRVIYKLLSTEESYIVS